MSEMPRPFMEYLKDIPRNLITPSLTNPRKAFNDAKMEELRASIAVKGIQQPIIVRPKTDPDKGGDGYEIVAGERRWRAVDGHDTPIPCIIRELNDEQALEVQIIENLQRADIHPAEEADAYAVMMLEPELAGLGAPLSIYDIAKKVGKPAGYVAARLRLRTLELDAKLLFVKEHITLGHALLLARLEPVDQERAIKFMLNVDPKYDKRPVTEIVRDVLRFHQADGRPVYEHDVTDEEREQDEDEEDAITPDGRPDAPKVAKYMHHGRRLIDATEAQLKRWIESNILLKLGTAPWRLDDAVLVPAAGACITCPKRSGSNAALFGELTADADVCMDPSCFGAKQDATVRTHKEAARQNAKAEGCAPGGGLLLKISAKGSEAPLEEIAVEGGQVVTRKTVKAGQWVPVDADKQCDNTVQALVVDGPAKGKLLRVCADQKCKTHKHDVRRPYGGSSSKPEDPAKAAAAAAKVAAYVQSETDIRVAIYKALREKVEPTVEIIRQTVLGTIQEYTAPSICRVLDIPIQTKGDKWEIQRDAAKVLKAYVLKATGPQLNLLLFDALSIRSISVDAYNMNSNKKNREELWILARKYKVNADKIAEPKTSKPAAPAKIADQVARRRAAATLGKAKKPSKR